MPILSILGRAAGSGRVADPLPALAPASQEASGGIRPLDHVTSPPALAAAVTAMAGGQVDRTSELAAGVRALVGAPEGTSVHVFGSAHDATAGLVRSYGSVVSVGDTAPFPRRGFGGVDATRVAVGTSPIATARALSAALERAASPARTLVIVPAILDDTGEVVDVAALAALAHRHGAPVLVLARSVPAHRAFDLAATGADHLLLDAGCCYSPVRAAVLATVPGAAVVPAAPGPPSPAAVAAFSTAVGQLVRHREAIALHLTRLMTLAYKRLDGLPGVTRTGRYGPGHDRVSVLSFRTPGDDAALARALAEQGLDLAVRPSGLRVSVGLGSGVADLDRLALALRDLTAGTAAQDKTTTPCSPADSNRRRARVRGERVPGYAEA